MTVIPRKTVPAVLAQFDSTFFEFATAFNAGEYVLWLGSGISRDRVPNVAELIERVLEHLRSNIAQDNPRCEYRAALCEVLRLCLGGAEIETVDLSLVFSEWPLATRITSALTTQYSSVLDVPVGDDKPEDYLVWTALDAPHTYGAPSLEPDVEHYCIAVLMLEGLVSSAVTANWDGLLEKALRNLTESYDSIVKVAVRPKDFRDSVSARINLYKFHGCAVRALDDVDEYRPRLIARQKQILAWTQEPENSLMRKRLESLYTERRTLMLGLSAQDPNLHTIFAGAIQDLARSWPESPPPIVLSEERLEAHHRTVLSTTFGSSYAGNVSAIADSALLGAYGKVTLLALVLSSLTDKLSFLIEHEFGDALGPLGVKQLQDYLIGIRDLAADLTGPSDPAPDKYRQNVEDQREFTFRLIDAVDIVLEVFRHGRVVPAPLQRYEPLSDRPIAQAVLNPDFPTRKFAGLGVVMALIGRGLMTREWSAVPGSRTMPGAGSLRLSNNRRTARVFFVKDATTLINLELEGEFDDSEGDVLTVVADHEPRVQTRSPRAQFGRTGKTQARRFNVASSVAGTTTEDELYEAFKLAGGF